MLYTMAGTAFDSRMLWKCHQGNKTVTEKLETGDTGENKHINIAEWHRNLKKPI